MKVLVLLSLVALSFSSPIGVSKRIAVNKDSAISIASSEGRTIQIFRSEGDSTKIEIVLINPSDLKSLRIQVDEAVNFKKAKSKYIPDASGLVNQADVLAHIFGKHEGLVDQATYQNLLSEIEILVKYGILRDVVLRSLSYLDQPEIAEELRKELLGESYESVLPAGVSRVQVSGVRILDSYQNDLSYQRQYGLRNNQNLSPYQYWQTPEIQRQEGSGSERSIAPPSALYQSKYQSPLDRFWYNLRILRGQQGSYYPYPYIQQVPQMQGQYVQQYPQLLNQRQQVYQQWYQQEKEPHSYYNWEMSAQQFPEEWIQSQKYPQQFYQNQVAPQHLPEKWIQSQKYPQQFYQNQVAPQQLQSVERWPQQQVAPQQWNWGQQHYGYGRMPWVY